MIARIKGRTAYLPALPTRRQLTRLIRAFWLRFTAPRSSRKRWRTLDGRAPRICDMSNAHLLNALHKVREMHPARMNEDTREGLLIEAKRRRLPTERKPDWLVKRNKEFGEKQRAIANAVPYGGWGSTPRGPWGAL